MTYQPLTPWLPLDDLMLLSLGARIRYVRENIATQRHRRGNPFMSHDDFAKAIGTSRQTVIRWEGGSTPRAYAERIAGLTPYPPEAFGAPGEAELVRQTFDRRLRQLEAQLESERGQRDLAIRGVLARLVEFEGVLEQIAPGSVPQRSAEEAPK